MKVIWSSAVDSVFIDGMPLDGIGVNNWGLDKHNVLTALDKLCDMNVAVLGGDVYNIIDGAIKTSHDNWYCNREDKESRHDFVERSIFHARCFIENYQNSGKHVLFSLVPNI